MSSLAYAVLDQARGMPSLRSIQPTPEEVEEAKKILAAGKGVQKSKMQCMVVWIKKT